MAEHRKSVASHKVATRKTARKAARKTTGRKAAPRRWSQRVTRESDALDLKHGVFKLTDPQKIAASLKRSAERSSRRKTGAYRSALSMLTFYINRAGKTLPKTQRARLERAKMELKRQFGKDQSSSLPAQALVAEGANEASEPGIQSFSARFRVRARARPGMTAKLRPGWIQPCRVRPARRRAWRIGAAFLRAFISLPDEFLE